MRVCVCVCVYFHQEKLKELKELRMPELHNAAYRGDLKDTELLLEAGADAMEKFFTGLVEESFQGLCSKATSPLAIAIWKGKLEVAKLLAMNMPHDYVRINLLYFLFFLPLKTIFISR